MKNFYLFIFCLLTVSSGIAQCDDERHSTNWYDGWIACETAPSPNPIRGESYWVHYDLGYTYELGQTHFWNYNDPNHKNYGIKNLVIDYSTDGINWTEAGSVFLLQGSGSSYYEGLDGINLAGVDARYILITALENWGGTCYALSEVKIEIENTVTIPAISAEDCLELDVYPNPAGTYSSAAVTSICPGNVNYTLMNAFGQILDFGNFGSINYYKFALPIHDLSPGVYYVIVEQDGQKERVKLIVL